VGEPAIAASAHLRDNHQPYSLFTERVVARDITNIVIQRYMTTRLPEADPQSSFVGEG
jgi:hypothetical protein